MPKGKHFTSVANLREGDFNAKELHFILEAAQAAKATPSDVVKACVKMAHQDASKVGVPWFMPTLKRFM